MLGLFDWIKMGAAGLVGASTMLGIAAVYDATIDDPRVRSETRRIVEAEAERRTMEAIDEVSDSAEAARARMRYCRERGELYSFSTGECRER